MYSFSKEMYSTLELCLDGIFLHIPTAYERGTEGLPQRYSAKLSMCIKGALRSHTATPIIVTYVYCAGKWSNRGRRALCVCGSENMFSSSHEERVVGLLSTNISLLWIRDHKSSVIVSTGCARNCSPSAPASHRGSHTDCNAPSLLSGHVAHLFFLVKEND